MPYSYVCSLGIGKGSLDSSYFRDVQRWILKAHREGDKLGPERRPYQLESPICNVQ